MNKPVKDAPISVKPPPSAVAELARRVSAGEFPSLNEAVTAALLELEHFRAVELVGGEAAFQALAKEVAAHPDTEIGEVDAFKFLHDLKEEFRNLADDRDRLA